MSKNEYHHVDLGDAARDKGDWEKASQHYRKALKRNSKLTHIWVQLGHSLKEVDDLGEAEEAYREAVKSASEDADAFLHLGHVLKLQERLSDAEEAYAKSFALSGGSIDCIVELKNLGWTDKDLAETLVSSGYADKDTADGAHCIVFDVTDLMLFFNRIRTLTGIQRVQSCVVEAAMADSSTEAIVIFYAEERDQWVEIPSDQFLGIIKEASAGSDPEDEDWQSAVRGVRRISEYGLPYVFPKGATLVNLGTSWDFDNYHLMVRNAKITSQIRYIPFIHDCIPVVMPETCVDPLKQKYIGWIRSVLFSADQIIVNSYATRDDVVRLASELRIEIGDPKVCQLDGLYELASEDVSEEYSNEVLTEVDVEQGSYVLFVSTLEPRKNHLLALNSWIALIKKRGIDNVPDLVCVGKPGYLVETILAQHEASELLKQRVKILTFVSDSELSVLYRNCAFTIYPSRYEGWGLPVTEALCYGKTSVVSNVASLPEAGGDFVEYFESGSEPEFVAKVELLLDKPDYLASREAEICQKFEARTWYEIAEDIFHITTDEDEAPGASEAATLQEKGAAAVPSVHSGVYYSFAVNRDTSVRYSGITGEMCRIGDGWGCPEDWGCYFTTQDGCAIAFNSMLEGSTELTIYIGIRSLPQSATTYIFKHRYSHDHEPEVLAEETILSGDEDRWVKLVLSTAAIASGPVLIELGAEGSLNLADVTSGADRWQISGGITGFVCFSDLDDQKRHGFMEDVFMSGEEALLQAREAVDLFPW